MKILTILVLSTALILTILSLTSNPPDTYYIPSQNQFVQVQFEVFITLTQQIASFMAILLMLWGIGYTFTYSLDKKEDGLGNILVNIAIGLGIFPILSLILNNQLIPFPLDIRFFLILSLITPAYTLAQKMSGSGITFQPPKIKITKDVLYASIILLAAASTLYVLSTGAFQYPWLEDGDSWRHAGGVKYLATQKTYTLPDGVPVSDTLEPYPPTYDGYLALASQLNPSLQWSMKYFTSLLPALGLIGFYYFTKKFTGNMDVALVATIILGMMPSYPSHFIWAYTLGYILFFPALYSLDHASSNRKWMVPAIFQTASLMVIQALIAPTYGIILILYLIVRSLSERKLAANVLIVGVCGLTLSMLVFWIPMYNTYWGSNAKLNAIDTKFAQGVFQLDHERTTYPIEELLNVKPYGNIAIHHGVGPVLFPLFILSTLVMLGFTAYWLYLGFSKKDWRIQYYIPVTLAWTIFTFIGLESYALPVHFLPGRFWNIITLPIALTAGWGLVNIKDWLTGYLKDYGFMKYLGHTLIVACIIGILITSAYPRYQVQTSIWPMDFFRKYPGHLEGYLALKKLPPDTSVFPFCLQDDKVISFDKMSYPWDKEVQEFRGWQFPYKGNEDFNGTVVLDRNADETHTFLKAKGYKYAILCPECVDQCLRVYDKGNCTQKYVEYASKLARHPGLKPIYQEMDMIYEVV